MKRESNSNGGGPSVSSERSEDPHFPIVGVGASAGGLEAFTELLRHLPRETGMAFVLVQHLDPQHESHLTELLAKTATLPLAVAKDGTMVEPDHVYVMPSNTELSIHGGILQMAPRTNTACLQMPIDCFFRSLSQDRKNRAIGILLSGGGTDGTIGLGAIKGEGGLTFAQNEDTAQHKSMPQSAVAEGVVDQVLAPEEIARELGRLAQHSYVQESPPTAPPEPTVERAVPQPALPDIFLKILGLVRSTTGVDFTHYKRDTLKRRMDRRLALQNVPDLAGYLSFLESHPEEIEALHRDLLIKVTSFFREPGVFEVLKEKLHPRLFKEGTPEHSIRIWVPGCATGEEAYSLAICFLESAGDKVGQIPIQIFGTDVDEQAIEQARSGTYIENVALDVSPERLRRFFIKEDSHYQISKAVRDLCVFSRHNLIKDPPFSRLDLISCRNLLMYLDPQTQEKIFPVFSYALKPGGFLILGASESVRGLQNLFAQVDKTHKVFVKKPASVHLTPELSKEGMFAAIRSEGSPSKIEATAWDKADFQKEADRFLLGEYAPAGILVDEDLEILQFRGDTGPFLHPPTGAPSWNLMAMAKEDLVFELRSAIDDAKKLPRASTAPPVRVQLKGVRKHLALEVVPVESPQSKARCYLILFKEEVPPKSGSDRPVAAKKAKGTKVPSKAFSDEEVVRLRKEVAVLRSQLQSMADKHASVVEEFRSANEEILSGNEELQSMNQELQTSKEEIQSANEELRTLNTELVKRNEILDKLTNDLRNLLSSVNMPIVMLERDLRIRSFTPMAEKLLNLIPSDVGRPIGNFRPNIEVPDFTRLVAEVIDRVSAREVDAQDQSGRWYSMRVLPYKTLDNRIDGAVVVFVDVDEVRRARQLAEAVIETVREPLLVLGPALEVRAANRAFYQMFRTRKEDTLNRALYNLGRGQWNIPDLKKRLKDILEKDESFESFEVEHDFVEIGKRVMVLNARQIHLGDPHPVIILLAIEDVTEQKAREEDLRKSNEQLEALNRELDAFGHTVAHDLRAPLRTMAGLSQILLEDYPGRPLDEQGRDHARRIAEACKRMDALIQDLLSFSRLNRAQVDLAPLNMQDLLSEALANLSADLKERNAEVVVDEPLPILMGDRVMVLQVLSNLLANAVKFVAPGNRPRVEVWGKKQAGWLRMWIEDNGIGIPKDQHGRIFRMFERVTGSEGFPGTGIGLAIVKKAIDRMGGRVGFESVVGQGSRFWFELPAPKGDHDA